MHRLGYNIVGAIEEHIERSLPAMGPELRSIVTQAHEGLCAFSRTRLESSLAKLDSIGIVQLDVDSSTARYIRALRCVVEAAYHVLQGEQMEAEQ